MAKSGGTIAQLTRPVQWRVATPRRRLTGDAYQLPKNEFVSEFGSIATASFVQTLDHRLSSLCIHRKHCRCESNDQGTCCKPSRCTWSDSSHGRCHGANSVGSILAGGVRQESRMRSHICGVPHSRATDSTSAHGCLAPDSRILFAHHSPYSRVACRKGPPNRAMRYSSSRSCASNSALRSRGVGPEQRGSY